MQYVLLSASQLAGHLQRRSDDRCSLVAAHSSFGNGSLGKIQPQIPTNLEGNVYEFATVAVAELLRRTH